MTVKAAARRRPFWPMMAIGLFVLLAIIGLFVIALRDMPSPAEPETIEKLFAEQIAFLKELALACPDSIKPPSYDPHDDPDGEGWKKYNEVWQGWSEQSKSRPDLMSHPVIKGAAESEGDTPDVRQWRKGEEHLVRYEAYFVSPDGMNMGLQLLVDLNLADRADSTSD